jgi:hypothetical protein
VAVMIRIKTGEAYLYFRPELVQLVYLYLVALPHRSGSQTRLLETKPAASVAWRNFLSVRMHAAGCSAWAASCLPSVLGAPCAGRRSATRLKAISPQWGVRPFNRSDTGLSDYAIKCGDRRVDLAAFGWHRGLWLSPFDSSAGLSNHGFLFCQERGFDPDGRRFGL